MKTLAIYNVKGGVGKTAAAVNLAALAAASGLPTLLWDLDPQGAASWYLHADGGRSPEKSVWRGDKAIGERIVRSPYPGLDVIPSDLGARHLDVWLRKDDDDHGALRALTAPLSERYALLIFDCPPSLSHVADAVFAAADQVLVPVVPTHLSLRALMTLIEYFAANGLPRERLRPFWSMADRRRLLHRLLIETPPKPMRDVCHSVIPYSATIERMGEARAPLAQFAAGTPAAEAYQALWQELAPALR